MNSFTGIFQRFYLDYKNFVLSSPCSPMYWIKPHQSNFEEPSMLSTPVGNSGMGLGGVIPLVGSRTKAPKAPTILRYLKPEKTEFWTILKRTLEFLNAYFWAKNEIKKYLGYIWVLWCFAIFVAYPW